MVLLSASLPYMGEFLYSYQKGFDRSHALTIRITSDFIHPVYPFHSRVLTPKKISKSKWQWIAVSGFLGTFFPNFLFAYAETKIDSAIAAVLNGLTPLLRYSLGCFFLE